MFRRLLSAVALLALFTAPVQAQSPANGPFRDYTFAWVLGAAFEYGGDRFADFVFTNGDTQTMRAGQGGTAFAGVAFHPAAAPRLGIEGTVGVKYVTTAADNANITLTRFPLDARATWSLTPDVFVGAGVTYHTGTKFRGDGFVQDVAFDPALGTSVRLGWRWIAATYTAMTYTDEFGFEYDAGSFGIALSAEVGKR